MKAVILTRATDWTGQTWEERLRLCAQTLFIHGMIAHAEMQRIENRAEREANDAREQAAG